MKHRNEWLTWTATAVGSLGLLGLASAQAVPQGGLNEALAEGTSMDRSMPADTRVVLEERALPITDDGWSANELPMARQLVVSRRATAEGPLRIEVFNERGEVVEHIDWTEGSGRVKPVALDALLAGRYAVRVTSGERSEVVRFRKD
ncbi:MAG: hypothetical protein KF797_12280 [Flavobacteriales bacterium]|nr:hypothetical protein [Flavobacteriales bacterium]